MFLSHGVSDANVPRPNVSDANVPRPNVSDANDTYVFCMYAFRSTINAVRTTADAAWTKASPGVH